MEKNLNPQKPQDAIQIIDFLTGDLKLTRKESAVFSLALNTLNTFVELNLEKQNEDSNKPKSPGDNGKTEPKPPKGRTIKEPA